MAKLLIEMLHSASTDKYEKYFPYPLHLLKLFEDGDKLIDINLKCFNKKNEEKIKIIDETLDFICDNYDKYDKIIVCAGSYIPDADKKEYYRYFLNKIRLPIILTGPYVDIFEKEIKKEFPTREIEFLKTDYNLEDVIIPLDMIKEYPKVGKKLKITTRISFGCPRKCSMCPVPLIYNGKYKFFNIEKTIEKIKNYYNQGVRFFNFIDDNISCSPKFIKFLERLKEENLKGAEFMSQEGFEVLAFHNEKFCELIKETNWVDVKLGIENIKENFLKKINKYYNKFDDIEKALNNIKKYSLNVKMYFLIGLEETYNDVIENLKFIAENGFGVRCNIIRPYSGTKLYKDGFNRKLSQKECLELRAFAHTISWLNETYKINFFLNNSLDLFIQKAKLKIENDDKQYIIKGRCYHGFKTGKFIKILQYMLEKNNNLKLKLAIKDNEKIIFNIVKKDHKLF